MNRKSFAIGLGAYLLWGVLPLFWHLLTDVDPLVILSCRVAFSAVYTVILLAVEKRFAEVGATLRDPRLLWRLIVSSVLITVNWGLYIWAVNSGHVLDASLGYYLNPLLLFAAGVLIFRDPCTKWDLLAMALVVVGVAVSTVRFHAFPWIALSVSLSFSAYGVFKKSFHIDAALGICIETLLMTPVAILFLLLSPVGQADLAAMTVKNALLLVAAGPITAVPLIMFARGVNDLPLSTMGFLQFICPTLQLLTGVLFFGEAFTEDKVITFVFVLAGLAVYTAGVAVREKKRQAAAKTEAPSA